MGCFLLIKRSVDIHLKVYCLDNELPKRTNKYLMVSLSLSLSLIFLWPWWSTFFFGLYWKEHINIVIMVEHVNCRFWKPRDEFRSDPNLEALSLSLQKKTSHVLEKGLSRCFLITRWLVIKCLNCFLFFSGNHHGMFCIDRSGDLILAIYTMNLVWLSIFWLGFFFFFFYI